MSKVKKTEAKYFFDASKRTLKSSGGFIPVCERINGKAVPVLPLRGMFIKQEVVEKLYANLTVEPVFLEYVEGDSQ
jgi:hypothetical protein